jgi:hypothetical protein
MQSIREIEAHFAGGAESVTLTRKEWEGIQEIDIGYFATGCQLGAAEREIERVKRIARPLWRACKRVALQMRGCACMASQYQVRDWELRLRLATEVDWHDLPMDKRAPMKR